MMKGHVISVQTGVDRYGIYTSLSRRMQWVFGDCVEKTSSQSRASHPHPE
jgi:hypothetical protein